MSGGVDSSVAAMLLVEEGYRVLGVTMLLWAEAASCSPEGSNQPGTPSTVERARAVARQIGIPLHVVDLREPFKRQVVDYLVDEYLRGRTPNPCLACNRTIKFGRLLGEARRLGGDVLATGHYVRTTHRDGRWYLMRGSDRQKDQSYALYMLGQDELAATRFPLGDLTKDEVRRIAAERNLPAAHQPESQEICFIEDDDYRRFLRQMVPERLTPGVILDTAGREIGRHKGLPFYTIGQRKGLGIAAREPLYVIALDVKRNAVIAGPKSELGQDITRVEQVSYISGLIPEGPFASTAKIRYKAVETEAIVTPIGPTTAEVQFAHALRDITPGQAVVFYDGEIVLGGGIISSPLETAP